MKKDGSVLIRQFSNPVELQDVKMQAADKTFEQKRLRFTEVRLSSKAGKPEYAPWNFVTMNLWPHPVSVYSGS